MSGRGIVQRRSNTLRLGKGAAAMREESFPSKTLRVLRAGRGARKKEERPAKEGTLRETRR